MYQALFYKEWIKTRRVIWLAGIIFTGMIIYSFIDMGQAFRVGGAVTTWSNVLLKDASILPSAIRWAPLLAALLLAFSQFVPEMVNKRLKLTLHLPLPETNIMSSMLCYGVAVLLALYLFVYAILLTGLAVYYPYEILMMMTAKSLPWFLGGLAGYLLAAWVCLEPVWRQRICNSFIAICALSLFFLDAPSGAYLPLLGWLAAIALAAFGFPFYSASHFKEGKQ